MAPPELNATISERIDLGPELMLIRVVPNGWEIPQFKPGQFAILGLPGSAARGGYSMPDVKHPDPNKFIQRAYSIASTPLNKNYLEFYITLVRDGALTPRLWCLRMADRLYLSAKISGHFVMDDIPEDQNVVFIATGTGIAPFTSMVQTFLKPNMKRRFALLHGVRQSQDLGYRSDMLAFERICPNFNYFPIISRERDDPVPWKGPIGRVQHILTEGLLEKAWGFKPSPANTHFFMCGNPKMILEVTDLLKNDGFTEDKKEAPGQIHIEKYW